MPVHKKVDIVTVGSGWTSHILSWKLGTAGHRVVTIEQGATRWADPDFAWNHDSLRYSVRKAQMVNLQKETWSWRPDPNAPSLPIRQYGPFHPGQGLGGSAIHWSGMLWRFTPYDFGYRSYYVQKYGEDKLPAGSSVQDWPLTYEKLEPYYDAFEYDIGASGIAGNLNGQIQPGGNPFEGPRSRPYPLPPLTRSIPSEMFADACTQLGYHPFPQPAGILSQAYLDPFGNHRSGCLYCGFCTRFGCEVDAKSTGITTHLPAALKTGNLEVRANCHVLQVNTGPDGLATGVTYIDEQGVEHDQPADVVILSAYTLTNVKLLLVSTSNEHPNGIGNDRGQVGRNCTHQMWLTPAKGVFQDRHFNLFAGNTSTINVIYDFYGNAIDHGQVDFIGGSSIFSTIGEREPVTSAGDLPITDSSAKGGGQSAQTGGGSNKWGKDWKEALRSQWDAFVPITIQGESPAYDQNRYDLDPIYKDAWGKPLLRYTFDWTDNEKKLYAFLADKCTQIIQQMGAPVVDSKSEIDPYEIHDYKSTHMTGGAIMGGDPGNSVTNSYGQVWDTPNVFVTGAALYPQNPGANPTGTLCALAYRTGDAIRDKYVKHPDRLIDS